VYGLIRGLARRRVCVVRRRALLAPSPCEVRPDRPRQQASYDDIAVLVKKADTDDVTCYYGWVGGTVYADYNELRLAWTLSEVAHAHIEGDPFRRRSSKSSRATSSSTSLNLEGTRGCRRPKSATG